MTEPSLTEPTALEPAIPAAPDGVSVDLAAAQGMPRAAERRGWAASLVAASTAHLLLVFGLLEGADRGPVGAGGTELEAINIEIVSAAVLESRSSDASAAAASSRSVDHERDGAQTEVQGAVAAADQKPEPVEPRERTAGPIPDLVVPEPVADDPEPDPSEIALAMATAKPEEPEDLLPEPDPQRQTEQESAEAAAPSQGSEARDSAVEGGAAARGLDAGETVAAAAAAASAGVASEYAKEVIQTLARRKPRATAGIRGTVRIGFTVARSGEVSDARILVSSGQSSLDNAALVAVRGTRFPAPPPALATARLSYEIPYIFR